MKVFVVFLAFMMVFVSFMCYSSDMARYADMQRMLKLAAEDCAAAGALASDPEAYGRGKLAIDEDEAIGMGFEVMDAAALMPLFRRGTLSMDMKIYDGEKGYEGCEAYGLAQGMPSVVCTLEYTGADIFRLPFLQLRSLSRTAAYSWDDRTSGMIRTKL